MARKTRDAFLRIKEYGPWDLSRRKGFYHIVGIVQALMEWVEEVNMRDDRGEDKDGGKNGDENRDNDEYVDDEDDEGYEKVCDAN
jgi:hypothetical protein